LQLSQANINLVKQNMEAFAEISDIKIVITKIEKEISKRD